VLTTKSSCLGALYLGIDFGTSGCRLAVIDDDGKQLGFYSMPLPTSIHGSGHAEQTPEDWWQALEYLVTNKLDSALKQGIVAIAVDGTSASLLLADQYGQALTPCLMYNDQRAVDAAVLIDNVAPAACSSVRGPNSALAKLLYFEQQEIDGACYALHQADWINNRLIAQFGHSDSNNCLKLGYDAEAKQWPNWLLKLVANTALLPNVTTPGNFVGTLDKTIAKSWSLPHNTLIVSGTTDSIAASLAAGAIQPGDAITSLGSTLVVKVVSKAPASSVKYGVYSHPYGDHWLVGGASNSGGAVLLKYFSLEQINAMSEHIDPGQETGLDYYPLANVGERFPFADPNKHPKLSPRPEQDSDFFQAMLEGIAYIEQLAYQRLAELGATPVKRIISVGGGSKNKAWQCLRECKLNTPLTSALSNEAAYGSALLAREGYRKHNDHC